ncbi:MAG: hypothetical protein LBF22_07905 [Deltaproteobacteria bacterium]|jgi:nucleoid DNA-binding protein|nr:hypothetical protein [Deltaproteobacteria bacterium]
MPPKEPLNKSNVLARLVALNPEFPPQVTRLAGEIIFDSLKTALSRGQDVSLRGFGRFIPRTYGRKSRKKMGLLFHPSPQLIELVNKNSEKATPKKTDCLSSNP